MDKNMSKTNDEKILEGFTSKEAVLSAIREKPMYRKELNGMFNLDNEKMTNYLTSLKNFNLIQAHPDDLGAAKNKRRWARTDSTASLEDCLRFSKEFYLKKADDKRKALMFIPNTMMRVSIDDYHTTGNKRNLSAWAGYNSMAMM